MKPTLTAFLGLLLTTLTLNTASAWEGKIIGENDLTPVLQDGSNIPAKYTALLDAFGRMSMGCTATHIGKNLAITAGHCMNAGSTPAYNASCTGVTVEWGYRSTKVPNLVSKCEKVLVMEQNDNRDYALFLVNEAPKAAIELELKGVPAVGTPMTIFGHPQKRPLEWSKLCTVQGKNGQFQGKSIFTYQCDTEGGSSGSAIIDNNTLKIVGIHDGGLVPWNYATFIMMSEIPKVIGGTRRLHF